MENEKKEDSTLIPFYKLFEFADVADGVLMIMGSIGAIVNGLCTPILTILFAQIADSFHNGQIDKQVVHLVSKVSTVYFRPHSLHRSLECNESYEGMYSQLTSLSFRCHCIWCMLLWGPLLQRSCVSIYISPIIMYRGRQVDYIT